MASCRLTHLPQQRLCRGGAAAAATLASLTVVVGAPGNDDKATNAGAAYVYKVSAAGAVAAQTKLLAPDGELYDKFGTSVVGLYVHVESS